MPKKAKKPRFTDRQRDTILAALRFWQAHNYPTEGHIECTKCDTTILPRDQRKGIDEIAWNSGEPLGDDEINTLCEFINTGGLE